MRETEIVCPTQGGSLSGSLVVPAGAGPWPAALLVSGSGPTDRDGNNPLDDAPSGPLKQLAHALAERGVASLRYDKRGVGASTFPGLSEEALRFDALVDDAVALARMLLAAARFDGLVLAGHSEGALIAALASAQVDARAVVSISGAGERASNLLRRQVAERLPGELGAEAGAAIDALEAGRTLDDVPEALVLLFRPSVQPYLISWFRHDPAAALAAAAGELLLVHGDADAQVPVAQARLLQAAAPHARLLLVPGMDHLMRTPDAPGAGIAQVAQAVRDIARATMAQSASDARSADAPATSL
jgi:fermentation-respiration switch protein FrsA (DUF1100 family)